MADMKDLSKMISEREVSPHNALVASLLLGFSELGVLNQGTVNMVGRRISYFLTDYFEAIEAVPDVDSDISMNDLLKVIIECVNKYLDIAPEIYYELEENRLHIWLKGGECKICPKGVGGLELKGTFCPLPSMFAGFMEHCYDNSTRVKVANIDGQVLQKKEGECHFYLEKN